jgi:hypothetical protein
MQQRLARQSEIDKRGNLRGISGELRESRLYGPHKSCFFFLMMDCMKASTTDNAETLRCVLCRGHTLAAAAAAAAAVGIGVNAVGGWVMLVHLRPRQHGPSTG